MEYELKEVNEHLGVQNQASPNRNPPQVSITNNYAPYQRNMEEGDSRREEASYQQPLLSFSCKNNEIFLTLNQQVPQLMRHLPHHHPNNRLSESS